MLNNFFNLEHKFFLRYHPLYPEFGIKQMVTDFRMLLSELENAFCKKADIAGLGTGNGNVTGNFIFFKNLKIEYGFFRHGKNVLGPLTQKFPGRGQADCIIRAFKKLFPIALSPVIPDRHN